MDGNFLTSKDERHIDLLVARHFPDASKVSSVDILSTRDAAIHGIGQTPERLVSTANSVGWVWRLLGDLSQRKSGIKYGSQLFAIRRFVNHRRHSYWLTIRTKDPVLVYQGLPMLRAGVEHRDCNEVRKIGRSRVAKTTFCHIQFCL